MNVEQLVVSRWLDSVAGERLSAAEAICRMAMTPGLFAAQRDPEAMPAYKTVMATAIARTGAVFVVDAEDWLGMVREVDWRPDDLPPWPYPRCWVEVHDPGLGGPGGFTAIDALDGQTKGVIAYAVLEEIPAAKWVVFAVVMDGDGETDVETWETYPPSTASDNDQTTGSTTYYGDATRFNDGSMPHDELTRWVAAFDAPIALAQILTTVGARLPEVAIPRAASRRFQRRWGLEHPNIYRVDLRGAGDDEQPGRGDREYRHRWLVRGHYRRHERGEYVVPGKGRCSWVRAYVKGPKGAPWKGRPIYTTGEAAA